MYCGGIVQQLLPFKHSLNGVFTFYLKGYLHLRRSYLGGVLFYEWCMCLKVFRCVLQVLQQVLQLFFLSTFLSTGLLSSYYGSLRSKKITLY